MSPEQRAFWQNNGYLVLPQFFSSAEIDAIDSTARAVWRDCPSNVLVDNLKTGRRSFMNELSEEEKTHHFKVMDLYLDFLPVRAAALHERLVPVLSDLLDGPPVLGATLNFEKGSQQDYHVDSIFLTPETEGHLVATWIALEDVHSDAGALTYFPGSHLIRPYRFSDGGRRAIPSEMAAWRAYMMPEIEKRGLKPQTFFAKKGDVFVWHAELVHGGSPIRDYTMTRKSLVSHYFSLKDSKTLGRKLASLNGGFWHERAPIGTTQQLVDIVPAAHVFKKLANRFIPEKARPALKGVLRRMARIR